MFNGSKTIVVAEDDALIRMVAADELAEAGYDVIEAEDAEDALRALRQQEVFLLFTDVNMPGEMDGLGLARLVHDRWPQTRVIVTSADHRVRADDCKDVGAFLRKPYHIGSVLAQVASLAHF